MLEDFGEDLRESFPNLEIKLAAYN